MTIRRYREADHDAVFALHNLALNQVGAHAGNGPWDDDLHHVREVYLDAGGDFLVGEEDGRVVAMGALRRLGPDRAAITRMRVHPDRQRRGWGRAVLKQLEARAIEFGFRRLTLETTVQQMAARTFYETMGYVETGRSTSHGFEVILYEKRL
jgi:ribosomal protein S18 acetylase RimI-like enzyme